MTLDGSGVTYRAIGGASGVSEVFLTPAQTSPFALHRLQVQIEDGSGFQAEDYGSIPGGVSTGVRLFIRDENGNVQYELTDPLHPVKTNGQWASYASDESLQIFGAGNDFYTVRWDFHEGSGKHIMLPPGWQCAALMRDDFSDLIDHHILAQGYLL
jgi:hypothetical protein